MKNKLTDQLEKLRVWWRENDGFAVMIATAVTAFVTYFYYLTLEPLNSDCFAEGFLQYHNDTWAIQLGKWMVPIYAKLSGHIVSPVVYLILYALSVSVSAILLAEIWGIRNRAYKILAGALMMAAPAIVGQIIYIYLFFAFAMSLLLSVLSTYIAIKSRDRLHLAGAALLMACALASYQPYIGDILVIITGTLILHVLREDNDPGALLRFAVRMAVFVISGLAVYWGIMQMFLKKYGFRSTSYAGINDAGVLETLINIPRRIKHTYRIFWWYYRDSKLGGCVFWTALAALAIFSVGYAAFYMIRRRAYWKAVIVFILILFIPPCANFMYLVLPEHGIQLQMTYQMQLIGPLCIAVIVTTVADKHSNLLKEAAGVLTTVCLVGLIIGYSYCAYSSFRTLDIGSRHIKLYIQNALFHAIEDDEYKEGMPIVCMGFVDDDPVQEKNPLQKYSYYERAYPFWRDRYEVFSVWPKYCWYNFGIDIGKVSPEQYDNILTSDEFKSMEDYPSNKAYAIIDGCYVILLNRESVQE